MGRPKGVKNKIKVAAAHPYDVRVKVMGKVHAATGPTLEEAIDNLKIKNARGLSVWNVNGKEKVVSMAITSRLFALHGIAREIAMKKFKMLFGA